MSKNQSTFSIQLNNLRLFGYHGLYEEEKILGNEFELSISMKLEQSGEEGITIKDTINYADVYELVKKIFAQPDDLLETICINIAAAIKTAFPQMKMLSIQIIKLHPPITGFVGSVSVTYKKKYR